MPIRFAVLSLSAVLLAAGCSSATSTDADKSTATPSPPAAPTVAPESSGAAAQSTPTARPTAEATAPAPAVHPALSDWFDQVPQASAIRLGTVRERTAAYTSYDVSYRSDGLLITGVLAVPTGPGPFPAVALAHGWTDRASSVTGQGMTRERGYLAQQGYIALSVDYRNHAGSDDDPDLVNDLFVGYAVDTLGAVAALRASDLPVDDDRIAIMGRSMGGQVVLQALEMAPGYVSAGIVYSGQSSLEAQNYDRWGRDGTTYADFVDRHGTPQDDPAAWRAMSTRPYFARITEPVLMIHATEDEECPPPWAAATRRALAAAGVNVRLHWYDGEHHAFGPQFTDSMRDTVIFLRSGQV